MLLYSPVRFRASADWAWDVKYISFTGPWKLIITDLCVSPSGMTNFDIWSWVMQYSRGVLMRYALSSGVTNTNSLSRDKFLMLADTPLATSVEDNPYHTISENGRSFSRTSTNCFVRAHAGMAREGFL